MVRFKYNAPFTNLHKSTITKYKLQLVRLSSSNLSYFINCVIKYIDNQCNQKYIFKPKFYKYYILTIYSTLFRTCFEFFKRSDPLLQEQQFLYSEVYHPQLYFLWLCLLSVKTSNYLIILGYLYRDDVSSKPCAAAVIQTVCEETQKNKTEEK